MGVVYQEADIERPGDKLPWYTECERSKYEYLSGFFPASAPFAEVEQ